MIADNVLVYVQECDINTYLSNLFDMLDVGSMCIISEVHVNANQDPYLYTDEAPPQFQFMRTQ